MAGYTKLSSTLVTSTVWRENSTTRCVWITMLALADQHGEVQASIPGLADVSRVTIQECEAALAVFLAPDIYSRTKTNEGRRLMEIDGGWCILNYDKYRDLLSMEHRRTLGRERARRFRDKAESSEEVTQSNAPVTRNNDKQKQTQKQIQTQQQNTTTSRKLRARKEPSYRSAAGAGTPTELTAPSENATAIPKVTWLTPYFEAWKAAYGGTPNGGQLAKSFKPLHDEHGPDETARRWAVYLAATGAPYASPSKFAATWGSWTGTTPSTEAEDAYLRDVLADAALSGYANLQSAP